MEVELRASLIVEVSLRGDPRLTKAFAADMLNAAKAEERERILQIVEAESGNYSYKEEMVRPSIVAAIFLESVRAKARHGSTKE